ncbi:SAV_2336 N-terminal domain-related protein [Streptomyces sp. NPDC016309]|uniref:SAV_2336 N-terminal domain-related protein n=1 Tax=Streptomyces sp. NPDC016309 TaxID=3364965 RepID=UPI0036F5E142
MIERLSALLGALGEAGDPPLPREVAELVWLARALPAPAEPGSGGDGTGPAGPPGGSPEPVADPDRDPARPRPEPPAGDTAPGTEGPGAAGPGTRLYLPRAREREEAPDATVSAVPVRLAGPATLPGARELARALRPLKRRSPSRVRTVLDEDATAERAAERRHWLPVMAPAADRWFDVTLVVDTYGDGAAFWIPLGRALNGLLRRTGAFRDVRTYCLRPGADGRPGLAPTLSSAASSPRAPGTAVDPTGRTVTLVLTDGVAPQWRSGALRAALREWASAGPTAVVQPLPDHLWARTALPPVPVRFHGTGRGVPGARLRYVPYGLGARAPEPGDVAVPVLAATPEWLGPWAAAVAGGGCFDGAAVLLPADGAVEPTDPGAPRAVGFEEFRASAQPRVFRLAACLAAAPLNLPVMRMVQSTMLPDSPVSDLAEIVFSGLLRRVPGGGDGLDAAYEFVPGVRERLLGTLRRDEADEVVAAVSAYADGRAPGTGPRFTAAVPAPAGPLALPSGARHWAEVRDLVRRRQGRPRAAGLPGTPEGRLFLITLGAEHPHGAVDGHHVHSVRNVGRMAAVFTDAGYQHVLPELAGATRAEEVLRAVGDWAGGARLGRADAVVVYAGHTDVTPDGYRLLAHGDGPAVGPLALHELLAATEVGHVLLLLDVSPSPPGGITSPEDLASRSLSRRLSVLEAASRPDGARGSALVEAVARVLAVATADEGQAFLDTARTLNQVVDTYRDLVEEGGEGPGTSRLHTPAGPGAPRLFPNPLQVPALATLVSWLRGGPHDGRMRVVTGSAGSGKSRILRRLARLVPSAYPLTAASVFPRSLHGLATRAEPVALLIDDLDAIGDPRSVHDLVQPLAALPHVRLVVATRPEALPLLGPHVEVLDLDEEAYRAAPADFVRALLDGVPSAAALGAHVAGWAGGSVAVARALAGAVREGRLSAGSAEAAWLPEAEAAVDARLRRFGDDRPEVERWLLPLAYAGDGGSPPPPDLWAVLADALADGAGRRRDSGWVLRAAADLFVPGTYRLCRAVDHYLRAGDDPASVHGLITEALLDLVPRSRADGRRDWRAAPGFVRTHLATHAAAAGSIDTLLEDSEFVVQADPGRLLRALDPVATQHGRQVAEVYRAVAPVLGPLGPVERRGVLAVEAASRRHFRRLTGSFARPLPWRPLSAGVVGVSVVDVFSSSLTPVPTLFVGGDDGAVLVRQLPGGTRDHVLTGHVGPVRALDCVAIDGRPHTVTGGDDGTVRVCDLATGALRSMYKAYESPRAAVRAVACTVVDGRPCAVIATEGAVTVIDLAHSAGRPLVPPLPWRSSSLVCTVASGRPVAVLASAGSLDVWDFAGTVRRVCAGPVPAMAGVVLHGQPHVLHGHGTQVVYGWNAATGAHREVFRGDGAVTAVATTVIDGRPYAVTAEEPGSVVVRDLSGGHRTTVVLPRPARSLTAAGRFVAVTMDDTAVFIELRPVG